MDHAEAHERIADLVLEPQALRSFDEDPSDSAVALRAHLDRCDECRAEMDEWRQTHATVLSTLDDGGEGGATLAASVADGPLRSPASLRVAISSIPRSQPHRQQAGSALRRAETEPSRRRRIPRSRLPVLLAAAMLVVAIGAGTIAIDQARRADLEQRYAAALAGLTASVVRVLRDPSHVATALVDRNGSSAGSATWSADEIVVMTTVLDAPASGYEYRCWFDHDGKRNPIGVMQFGDGIAYWWGDLSAYSGLLRERDGQIGVSLEAIDGAGGGIPVLVGDLPG